MSNTILLLPVANFKLIRLAAIIGSEFSQAISFLNLYIFPSAGAKLKPWFIIQAPTVFTLYLNSSILKSVLKPGIDSNLSIVPPDTPYPLLEIFATGTSKAANIGIKIIVALSPIPPVECLSTILSEISLKSIISPDSAIFILKFKISSFVNPLI